MALVRISLWEIVWFPVHGDKADTHSQRFEDCELIDYTANSVRFKNSHGKEMRLIGGSFRLTNTKPYPG